MVKFLYSRNDADAEEVLENINRYILLGEDNYQEECLERYKQDTIKQVELGLQKTNLNCNISVFRVFAPDNPIKTFIKRVIRKMISWLLVDIVDQQMEFNRTLVAYLNHQNDLTQILLKENNELKTKINLLQKENSHGE